jgi:hypothetical protein
MQIQINIPQSIIDTCKECELNENQTKELFGRYIREVINDPYNQFINDFNNWINSDDGEDHFIEVSQQNL